MELEERAEEILETLWIHAEEMQQDTMALSDFPEDEQKALKPLLDAGYITVSDDRICLTEAGRPEARNVVRRHRLAERLLADVLGTGDFLIHDKACKFEHLLDRGLDESICSLLGHPKVCPHGKPIPPGPCCQQKDYQIHSLVLPLSQLAPGQRGKVAYLYAPETGQMQKLMAMGILPGAPVSLIQSFPSYVFQVNQTQFAVDKDIAGAIFVRLVQSRGGRPAGEARHPPERKWLRGLGRWGGRRGRTRAGKRQPGP